MVDLAEVETAIELEVRLDDVRWEADALVLRVSGSLAYGDGRPLSFTREGDRLFWDPLVELGPHVASGDRDVTGDLEASRIDVFVHSREDDAEFVVPTDFRVERTDDGGSVRLSLAGEARLDPAAAAAGQALASGVWEVHARVRVGGWAREAKLVTNRADSMKETLVPAVVGKPVRVVIPFFTPRGELRVDLDQSSRALRRHVTPADAEVRRRLGAVAFALALPAHFSGAGPATVELHAKRRGRNTRLVSIPARISTVNGNGASARLEARLPLRTRLLRVWRKLPTGPFLSPGSWRLSATIGPSTKGLGLVVDVAGDGAVVVRGRRRRRRRAPTERVTATL